MRVQNHTRRGYTLLELVVSMAAGSLLLVGMSSTLFIATRIVNTPRTADAVIEGSRAAYNLADELQYAIYITAHTEKLIEFAVADADGDNTPDVIRYEWSGAAGEPLVRTFNDRAEVVIVENVQEFALTYDIQEKKEELPGPPVESDESVLTSYTALQHDHGMSIEADKWAGQYFHPGDFNPAMPADAISWKVTKLEFQARQEGTTDGQVFVQLRPATGDGFPTSTVLGQEVVDESSLDATWNWRQVVFGDPVSDIKPNSGLCLVVKWAQNDKAAAVRREDHMGSGWLETSNAGASWTLNADRKMYYKIYGTVTTPNPTPVIVNRNYLTGVHVALRASTDAASRVDTRVQVMNSPELLSAYWSLNFDQDPTSMDVNFDGDGDWARRDRLPFDTGTLAGGVWRADAILDTYPDNDFSKTTTVEVRCRDTTVDTGGALFWINADWTNGDFAPLLALLQLQADNTQTLTVYHKQDNATRVPLVTVAGLSDDFQLLRLVILPDQDLVNVKVNGVDQGTYEHNTFSQANNDRFATIAPWNSSAEFDYVSVKVAE